MDPTTTPTAAPTPSASAPASSSAGTVTSTIGDARASLALAESSTATPESPAAQTPAAAVTPPADTPVVDPAPTEDPRSAVIPRTRFDEVNTRMQQAEASLKQYEGFKDFQPEELAGVTHLARGLKTDAVGTAVQLLEHLLADPQYAAAVQARLAPHAGRLLAANRGKEAAATADDPEPEPDYELPVRDANGNQVGVEPMYSAKRQKEREAWLQRQWDKRVDERLQPLQTVAQTFQQRETQARAFSEVGTVLTEMRADPDFKAHEADVKAEIAKDQRLAALADADPRAALEVAYARVIKTKVLPARDAKTREQVVADFQQRAAAGTTNPGAASTSAPPSMIGNARAALQYADSVVGAA